MKLYIPTYNSAPFLQALQPDPRFDVVIVDNRSQDDSVAIAKARGWEVAEQHHHCSRTKNWEFAAHHFLQSGAPWAKWLFTGDALYPNCYDQLQQAIDKFPTARLIVAEYTIATSQGVQRWSSLPATTIVDCAESVKLAAVQGNWFGAPIAHAFHRDAVAQGFSFGAWHWVADMQFFLSMACHTPILYLKSPIGTFNVEARKVFSKEQNALSSSIEEYLIRREAAALWLKMSGDEQTFRDIEAHIAADIERLIFDRAIERTKGQHGIRGALPGWLLKKGLGLLTKNR